MLCVINRASKIPLSQFCFSFLLTIESSASAKLNYIMLNLDAVYIEFITGSRKKQQQKMA
jgi:hypothetical protein